MGPQWRAFVHRACSIWLNSNWHADWSSLCPYRSQSLYLLLQVLQEDHSRPQSTISISILTCWTWTLQTCECIENGYSRFLPEEIGEPHFSSFVDLVLHAISKGSRKRRMLTVSENFNVHDISSFLSLVAFSSVQPANIANETCQVMPLPTNGELCAGECPQTSGWTASVLGAIVKLSVKLRKHYFDNNFWLELKLGEQKSDKSYDKALCATRSWTVPSTALSARVHALNRQNRAGAVYDAVSTSHRPWSSTILSTRLPAIFAVFQMVKVLYSTDSRAALDTFRFWTRAYIPGWETADSPPVWITSHKLNRAVLRSLLGLK